MSVLHCGTSQSFLLSFFPALFMSAQIRKEEEEGRHAAIGHASVSFLPPFLSNPSHPMRQSEQDNRIVQYLSLSSSLNGGDAASLLKEEEDRRKKRRFLLVL